MDTSAEAITELAERVAGARAIFVVTGAGISAASGIPTFRGAGGLWEGFRAEELATPQAFAADPHRVWRWYAWRKQICNDAQPNTGHQALVDLEGHTERFLLATQNVDGLHRRAGSESVETLHGCIDTARCTRCDRIVDTPGPLEVPPLPACDDCGGLMRPHIVWFGESYWPGVLERCAAFAEQADLALVVGTSGMVWPPMALALAAQRHGAYLVDINPNPSQISDAADLRIAAGAEDVLIRLVESRP